MNFSSVILAGGKSSRMGRDKAGLELEGQSLLVRQIKLVRDAGAGEVFISGRAGVDYRAFEVPVLLDEVAEEGPLRGIERALSVCRFSHLLVLAVDLPRMSLTCLDRLRAACTATAGAVSNLEGRLEPLVAIYPKSSLPLLHAAVEQGELSVCRFAGECVVQGLVRKILFDSRDAGVFVNWNQPGDFKAG